MQCGSVSTIPYKSHNVFARFKYTGSRVDAGNVYNIEVFEYIEDGIFLTFEFYTWSEGDIIEAAKVMATVLHSLKIKNP